MHFYSAGFKRLKPIPKLLRGWFLPFRRKSYLAGVQTRMEADIPNVKTITTRGEGRFTIYVRQKKGGPDPLSANVRICPTTLL